MFCGSHINSHFLGQSSHMARPTTEIGRVTQCFSMPKREWGPITDEQPVMQYSSMWMYHICSNNSLLLKELT